MTSRSRVWIVFMITLAMILAQANLASSQTITIGGNGRGDGPRGGPAIGNLN